MKKYLVFSSMGFELVGGILLAYYLGKKMDEEYFPSGLGTVICVFLVLILWFSRVISFAMKIQKNNKIN